MSKTKATLYENRECTNYYALGKQMKATLYERRERAHYYYTVGDGNGQTEDADEISREPKDWQIARFRRLSFGCEPGDKLRAEAIVDMELIWLLGLLSVIQAHSYVLATSFQFALTDPAYNDGTPAMDWYDYEQRAKEAGVDYQIEAYLEGTQLDYILSDCDITRNTSGFTPGKW